MKMAGRTTSSSIAQRTAKIAVLCLLVAASAFRFPAARCQTGGLSEYEVKAAFLLNIAKFVQWPDNSFESRQSPLLLCIVGDDPFGPALDNLVRDNVIDNHPLIVHRTKNLDGLRSCQVVFVAGADKKRAADVLLRLKGTSALAVGDSPDFAGVGGAIQFYMEKNRVRFCINVDALQRARLIVSSKLLALARIVHDGGSGNGG